MPPSIIGIAGTAKNTGKTTTLNAVLNEARRQSYRVAVTGIGYDGEDRDTITGLPKPRIELFPGDVVATSQRCLDVSEAKISVHELTGIITPLGEVVVGVVTEAGRMIIAGPGKRTDLRRVLNILVSMSPDIVLVDGSLNRVAPLAEVRKIIITTGGSRSTDIQLLAREIRSISRLFQLPVVQLPADTSALTLPHLLQGHDVRRLISRSSSVRQTLSIEGMILQEALEEVVSAVRSGILSISTLIIRDPIAMLMDRDIVRTDSLVSALLSLNVSISFQYPQELAFVTVNPFVPAFTGTGYLHGLLNRAELLSAVSNNATVPVFDTVHSSHGDLLKLLL